MDSLKNSLQPILQSDDFGVVPESSFLNSTAYVYGI